MRAFVLEQWPARTVFAPGAIAGVGAELRRLGANRVLLVHSRSAGAAAERIATDLGERLALRWGDVAQHVPSELAERARAAARQAGCDAVVCVGGGSAIGLAKAVALTSRVPIVAVPTTYAGSEQTSVYGITGGLHKQTGKDPFVQPRAVVYDPELTLDLPADVTGPSAFNALAHAVEALWAPGANPVTAAVALESVRCIAGALPAVMERPRDLEARGQLLVGAALAGMALGATAPGLHHKICHALGGLHDLVHADAHSVVLPHVVWFNAPDLPEEMARLAAALGRPGDDPAAALVDLAVASHVPTSLSALSGRTGRLQRNELDVVAEEVARDAPVNPRPVDARDVLTILERAYVGHRPARPTS